MVKYLSAAYLVNLGIRAILERSPDGIGMESSALSPRKAFRQADLAEVF